MTAPARGKLFNDPQPSSAITHPSSWHIYSQIYFRERTRAPRNPSTLSRRLTNERKRTLDRSYILRRNDATRFSFYR